MFGIRKSAFALAIVSAVSLTAASESVECFVLKSPEKILDGVKKIAILPFEGNATAGRAMADYLVANLMEEQRGIRDLSGLFVKKEGKTFIEGARTNVFELVERTQLDKILTEQNLSNSGVINEQQAAQVGKVLGLDAIVTGNLSYSSVDEQETNQYKNPKTGQVRYEYCTIRKVTAKARLKIISVNTAQIIGTTDTVVVWSQKKCDEERSGLSPEQDLADLAYKSMAGIFVDYFAPKFILGKYKFESIRAKEFKDRAKSAEDALSRGDLDNAFAVYKAVYDADPYNVTAAGAVCQLYDMAGNYEKALEYAKIAAELEAKDWAPMVKWVEKEIAMAKMLAGMGVQIAAREFGQKADALSERVKTRGGKSDRYEAREKPDAGSAVVAKVPGETEFVVLGNQGEWVKVKLLGGKEGFLNKENLK